MSSKSGKKSSYAKGRKLKVHKLCTTKNPVFLYGADTIDKMEGTLDREDGEISIASYMNFLIVNGGVIVPQYGGENDALGHWSRFKECTQNVKLLACGQKK